MRNFIKVYHRIRKKMVWDEKKTFEKPPSDQGLESVIAT